MILLIPMSKLMQKYGYEKFKFHYDSINSPKGYDGVTMSNQFKFHYDSINSLYSTVTPRF